VFWLMVANVWGAVIGWHLDLRTRREFAAMSLLAQERERSENLLRNILPAAIAERLKTSRDAIAEQVDEVTVLFADLVGFTALAERLPPQRLVALLDRVFSEFDLLADTHGLEKIKTIGDAYMAVAGVPHPCGDHALRAARMARGMLGAVRSVGAASGEPLALRVGIHSGSVVAGVIGTRKFSYDLWGDTVNTASRMESHAAPGTIQCTRATADRLHGMALRSRGEVNIKGKRALETFELEEAEEEATAR
jgi:adenylate cyclase